MWRVFCGSKQFRVNENGLVAVESHLAGGKHVISGRRGATRRIFNRVLLTRSQNPVVKESRCKLLLSPSGQVTLATNWAA